MTGKERRENILDMLSDRTPVTGSRLASHFGVSRQVIVQDIALLRAANHTIIATTNGYLRLERN